MLQPEMIKQEEQGAHQQEAEDSHAADAHMAEAAGGEEEQEGLSLLPMPANAAGEECGGYVSPTCLAFCNEELSPSQTMPHSREAAS